MEVELMCRFVVELPEGGDPMGRDHEAASCAADLAAFHHLAFVNSAGDEEERVTVHVDGVGCCIVELDYQPQL